MTNGRFTLYHRDNVCANCRRKRHHDHNSYILRTSDLTYGRTLSYPYTDKVFMDFSVENYNSNTGSDGKLVMI